MYLAFFSLTNPPFQLTPDTAYFYHYRSHREAMNVLLLALREGEGFLKITGEVGTGKTLLCRLLLKALEPGYATAYLPNPRLSEQGLLRAVADELGIASGVGLEGHALVKALQHRLIELRGENRPTVLLVDEAQTMPEDSLQALRLLTNLETEKHKLLQVVLFGQSELDERLRAHATRPLLQRITFSYDLGPLDREGVAEYVAHRLAVAGHNGAPLFTRAALKSLHHHSHGIPRLVNTLAHKSLMVAYGLGDRPIKPRHVRAAAADSQDQISATARPWRLWPRGWR